MRLLRQQSHRALTSRYVAGRSAWRSGRARQQNWGAQGVRQCSASIWYAASTLAQGPHTLCSAHSCCTSVILTTAGPSDVEHGDRDEPARSTCACQGATYDSSRSALSVISPACSQLWQSWSSREEHGNTCRRWSAGARWRLACRVQAPASVAATGPEEQPHEHCRSRYAAACKNCLCCVFVSIDVYLCPCRGQRHCAHW